MVRGEETLPSLSFVFASGFTATTKSIDLYKMNVLLTTSWHVTQYDVRGKSTGRSTHPLNAR